MKYAALLALAVFAPLHLFAIGAKSVAPPAEEARAVAFLVREVPRWKAEHDCYSCHNNGDAARALIVAARGGHDVGPALDDTLDWLRHPQKWNNNKTQGGNDNKRLARVQFAGALRLAVDAGQATRDALSDAATIVAADQRPDGSWQLDASQSVGSPTTYGTTLATWAATRVLFASHRDDLAPALGKANAWLRSANTDTVIDAAAVVLALGSEHDPGALMQRRRALATLARGQGADGGWGPYVTVRAEVFDTALVVLALSELQANTALAAPAFSAEALSRAISRGREYLLTSQLADGSWPETTRPSNQESYAQRISTTGWALLALIESR